jgi:hypothetical protein
MGVADRGQWFAFISVILEVTRHWFNVARHEGGRYVYGYLEYLLFIFQTHICTRNMLAGNGSQDGVSGWMLMREPAPSV